MSPLSHHEQRTLSSLDDLVRLADDLARSLRPGDVIALDGPLGAGKTTLVQKLGAALGLQESVASPTFVLMHEYLSGPFPVVHVDLYRLGPEKAASMADELYAIIDEGRTLVLVEWATYGADFLESALTAAVRIAFAEDRPGDEAETQVRVITLDSTRPLLSGNLSDRSVDGTPEQ